MIGFIALADKDIQELNIDINEIVEASWFHKNDVIDATKIIGSTMKFDIAENAIKNNPKLKLLIPPKGVIARTLIDYWIDNS